jgi:hypothetical protein
VKQITSRALIAYSLTIKMEVTCSSETLADIHGEHSITCQKKDLFITTTVTDKNPTEIKFVRTVGVPEKV